MAWIDLLSMPYPDFILVLLLFYPEERITPQLSESGDPHLHRFCSNMRTYTR